MKKIFSSTAIAAALLAACSFATSCEKENVRKNGTALPFSATTETEATRTSLSQDGSTFDVIWSEGDQIRVNGTILDIRTEDQPEGYGPGFTKASFAGSEPAPEHTEPYYRAYFPASMLDWAVTGGWFLPARQTYVPGSIKDVPMYATSNDKSLAFKNLCGAIRLNIKGDKSISAISLIDRADSPEPLSGRFTVSDNTAVVQGSDGVTLECTVPVELSTDEATPFMISVPAGSYGKLQITLFADDGSTCKLTSKKAIVVERALITDINISNPTFKSDYSVLTYTTTNTTKVALYQDSGDDASVFGDGLTVVSHTYDATTRTGVITLSGKATRFGYHAFFTKSNIKTITFPETITSVEEGAFYSCGGLEAFDFSHITSIGIRAFQGAGLYGLVIPENVQSIAERAFNGIKSTTVELKGAPTTMGPYIFESSSLVNATIDRKIDVPTGMFCNSRSLTGVTFKDGALSLGDYVFDNCRAIVGPVTLPAGTKSLGANLFRYCYALTGVVIPDSVTTIANNAFESCTSLTYVTIGTGITSIGSKVFTGANALSSLTIKAASVPALAGALNGSNLVNIYVPATLVDAYKTATNWSTYASTIQAITE